MIVVIGENEGEKKKEKKKKEEDRLVQFYDRERIRRYVRMGHSFVPKSVMLGARVKDKEALRAWLRRQRRIKDRDINFSDAPYVVHGKDEWLRARVDFWGGGGRI